uniref:Uncharacterized protein n=1 Tax=Candidatus Kentrum sp. LFY TaxID=2126342 RepID=A0A450UAP7_9GAMM|nr:MAG: hypothetical protein BECKLFY1418A_GA0070994_100643 [Candidatus Kentron sp. LFY]
MTGYASSWAASMHQGVMVLRRARVTDAQATWKWPLPRHSGDMAIPLFWSCQSAVCSRPHRSFHGSIFPWRAERLSLSMISSPRTRRPTRRLHRGHHQGSICMRMRHGLQGLPAKRPRCFIFYREEKSESWILISCAHPAKKHSCSIAPAFSMFLNERQNSPNAGQT